MMTVTEEPFPSEQSGVRGDKRGIAKMRGTTPHYLPLVTPKQLAKRLAISSRQVLRLPIRPHRLGPKTIRYAEEDILEYLKKARTTY